MTKTSISSSRGSLDSGGSLETTASLGADCVQNSPRILAAKGRRKEV
jgi:hypothetical protein